MKTHKEHQEVVKKIAEQIKDYLTAHHDKKLRFYHGSTNSTRDQTNKSEYYFIDISNLNDIIEINKKEQYALVEPNVSMDKLARATLEYNLLPPVVMEFPGITTGGAVNGATLEASSYKYGQFNDNCTEYEIVLGDGNIIKATAENYEDLFYGISGSYGSLGLLTLIKIKLIPVLPYVKTTFIPSGDYKNTLRLLEEQMETKENDFVDAIITSSKNAAVIVGQFSNNNGEPVETFSKASDEWFYERAEKVVKENKEYEELIPIFEFLFCYNQGAYWMGEYVFPVMHLPSDRLTKFLLSPFMNTRKLYDGLHALNISQNYFIQDFYCPIEKTIEFLEYSEKYLDIFPIWLCAMKPTTTTQKLSPSFIETRMIIDIGIWGQSKKYLKDIVGLNKQFEDYAAKVGARKMLYAHAYYTEEEFWKIYDKKWYENLRKKYHATEIFPDVWQKTHVGNKKLNIHFWKGILTLILESFKGKNLHN